MTNTVKAGTSDIVLAQNLIDDSRLLSKDYDNIKYIIYTGYFIEYE